MLDRNELNKYGPPGFHLAQKEKDYVQHWILSFISRSGFKGVFKGGTCLQKTSNLPRYSEDLDFTLNDAILVDMEAVEAFLSSAGFTGLKWKTETKPVSETIRLRFRGPLFNGSEISEGFVTMDFSKRERTLMEVEPVMIISPYPDILPYNLNIMNKDEIAAEKVRAIMTRNSARDLFDLYFLLHQKARLNINLIEKKLLFYNKKFVLTDFDKKIDGLSKIWKKEINALTPNMVDYELVAKTVKSSTKSIHQT
ncbi:MAG: nucleotidyl transferase AbiEii/AbiGii toxin family protein [Candidatus Micrarchaeota archaeon]